MLECAYELADAPASTVVRLSRLRSAGSRRRGPPLMRTVASGAWRASRMRACSASVARRRAASSRTGALAGSRRSRRFARRTRDVRIFERLPATLWPALAPTRRRRDRLSRGVRAAFDPHRLLNPGHLRRSDERELRRRFRSAIAALRDSRHAARGSAAGHRHVRALRLLPAGVSDVRQPRGRERQSARAHRAHARARRGRARARRRERANAHRSLPRLPRVRDGVSVRRAVRAAARGDARDAAHGSPDAVPRTHDPRRLRASERCSALCSLASRLIRATGLPSLFARDRRAPRLRVGDARIDATAAAGTRLRLRHARLARRSSRCSTGCVMSGLFARTNRATRRTLRANDYRVRERAGPGVLRRACTRTPATSRPRARARAARTSRRSSERARTSSA